MLYFKTFRQLSQQSSSKVKNPADEESVKNERASSRKISPQKLKETIPVSGDDLGQIFNDQPQNEENVNEANPTEQMDLSEIRYWNQVSFLFSQNFYTHFFI